MVELKEKIKIDEKIICELAHNMVKSAKAAELIYTSDSKSGFCRKYKGETFLFFDGTKSIKNNLIIERINKLRIPPAWVNV